MKGTSGVGKAAAGANDIMGATESRVKSFLHTFIQIGQFSKSFRSFLRNIDLAHGTNCMARPDWGILRFGWVAMRVFSFEENHGIMRTSQGPIRITMDSRHL
jgi:hypothetical protein